MRKLMGPTIGSVLSGLLIGSFLPAGPAPQLSPAILLSQIIESNPKPPGEQQPMQPLEQNPTPSGEKQSM